MTPLPLAGILLAAGLDWLEGLLPLLFVVIWIASQVLNLFRGAKRQEARPQRQPARPARPVVVEPRPGNNLNREIEEFLRGKVGNAGQQRQPRGSAPVAKPSRRRSRRPTAVEPPPLPAEVLPAIPRSPAAGSDIASHVASAFAHDLAHESPDSTLRMGNQAVVLSPADDLAAALRAPGGVRRLLLMQEVLTRPTHRW
jgi:hypothetical protein